MVIKRGSCISLSAVNMLKLGRGKILYCSFSVLMTASRVLEEGQSADSCSILSISLEGCLVFLYYFQKELEAGRLRFLAFSHKNLTYPSGRWLTGSEKYFLKVMTL